MAGTPDNASGGLPGPWPEGAPPRPENHPDLGGPLPDSALPDGSIPDGPIPDELVDRFFDDELDEPARRAFLRSLPADLDRCEEVAGTRRMLDLLRAGGESAQRQAPDLTGRIIAAVDARRGFASGRVRRIARVMRMGLAAGLVLFVGAVAAVERANPDATRLAPVPAPLTSAVRETQSEMASTLGSIATTIQTIQLRVEGAGHARGAWHEQAHRAAYAMPRPVAVGGAGEVDVLVVAGADEHGVLRVAGSRALRVPDDAPGKRLARDGEPARPMAAGRTVSVGLAWSLKPDPRRAAWTLDMAPTGATPRHMTRLIDADGRASGMVMPLGVDRGDLGGGPFVLPGWEAGRRAPQGVLSTPRLPLAP
jgi:hypothetical protein